MNNYLIIFIDGFSYELLEKSDFMDKFAFRSALTPGIGYSVNIHAEIFAGLSADQVNFFNTWKFDPADSPFRMLKGIKKLLGFFGGNRYLNRVFRNVIKLICRFDSLNIPYKFIDMFAPCGCSVYSKVFPRFKLLPDQIKEQDIISGTDAERYSLAQEKLTKEGRLSLFFVELDEAAHKFGIDSTKYRDSFSRLNGWINNLCDKFRSTYPNGHIVILSDHGMSKVERAVRLDLEKDFSSENGKRYAYFLDTTMLRIWYLDPEIKDALETFLNSRDYGRLLTEQERVEFGIANKKWADSIFLLNEGCVFDPSFLEKGHPLAMHGYHPQLRWQKGIFLYSGPKSFLLQNQINTLQCFNMLKEILNGGKN